MKNLQGYRVLVTGVGIKPVNHVFSDLITGHTTHTPVVIEGVDHKANIGAACALECARAGAVVHMVARNEQNLAHVADWIHEELPDAQVEYSAVDLSSADEIKKLAKLLPFDLPLYWVQSLGLGAGTVKVPNDNPYVPVDQIVPGLLEAEMSVLSSTLTLLQALLPRFEIQPESRVAIVSSMSAVRATTFMGVHAAAKGALSRFANAVMLELAPKRVFVSSVRPGGVDTGLYDAPEVQKAVVEMVAGYGYDWSVENGGLRLMPPTAVGEAIVNVLTAQCHITSVNMVAQGQFPHEGS